MFERLLLGQTQRKVFIIHNTSLLPVKWQLAGAEAVPPEFKMLPSSGEVPPRQEVPVTVEFTAMQKKDFSEKVTLQVSSRNTESSTKQYTFGMPGGLCSCTADEGPLLPRIIVAPCSPSNDNTSSDCHCQACHVESLCWEAQRKQTLAYFPCAYLASNKLCSVNIVVAFGTDTGCEWSPRADSGSRHCPQGRGLCHRCVCQISRPACHSVGLRPHEGHTDSNQERHLNQQRQVCHHLWAACAWGGHEGALQHLTCRRQPGSWRPAGFGPHLQQVSCAVGCSHSFVEPVCCQ